VSIERDLVPRPWPFPSTDPRVVAEAAAPKCEKCGAEITTGLMAVLCPLNTECALRGDAGESIDDMRKDFGVDQ
jgi:hypothetical protein